MPDNKNHHFVPRVHFKPFSADRGGRAINLINIERGRLVHHASISDQCSKSYFYGETPIVEKGLGYFEGCYGSIIPRLEVGEILSEDDFFALRVFTLLQFVRTEAVAKWGVAALAGGLDRLFAGDWAERRPPAPPSRVITAIVLHQVLKERKITDDLKMCILDNRTRLDLITSDNPAIAINRWYWQRKRDHRCGLASSGLVLILPLTVRLALCLFDSATYSCPGHGPLFRPITDHRDVQVLNELQILNADENIYFADWDSRNLYLEQVATLRERRPEQRVLFKVFVEDEDGRDGFSEGRRYRYATEDEITQAIPKMVMHSRVYPVPSRWISVLKIRSNPRVFTNGSAAGYVRNLVRLRAVRSERPTAR